VTGAVLDATIIGAERSRMITQWVRKVTRWLVLPIAKFMGRLGVSPNLITVSGFLLNIGVAYVLARGDLRIGGVLVLAVAAFDGLDGTLARELKQSSRFGAFLDSVMDRFSESTVYGGLLALYIRQQNTELAILIYAAIVGSLLVSYARARAEGVGVECKVGLLTRVERVAVLVIGLLTEQMRIALWVLAILANLTAIQRVVHVWRMIGAGDRSPVEHL
jgi:CDP-diacylglycerol--glycerol-3-phosphate 3-phosphatidyltransferase